MKSNLRLSSGRTRGDAYSFDEQATGPDDCKMCKAGRPIVPFLRISNKFLGMQEKRSRTFCLWGQGLRLAITLRFLPQLIVR